MSENPLHILLVEDNPGDAVLVQEMLLDADEDAFVLYRAESLLDGLDKLSQYEVDLLLLDLSLPDSQGLETFSTMQTHAGGAPIVVLTGNDNDALALAAVEAGAQDYLVKDNLDGQRLVRAVRYAVVRRRQQPKAVENPRQRQRGRLIGILGSRGGAGVTTIACHLAGELRRQSGAPVLIADLNPNAGAVGFILQTQSPYSLLDAADNIHRLDEAFWRTLVGRSGSGIDVLCSPGLLGRGEPPPPGRLRHTLRFARALYDWIIVDLGRLDPLSARVIPDLDRLVLVTATDLIAVHACACVVDALRELDFPAERMTLVQNQTSKWSGGSNVLSAVVHLPVSVHLPWSETELTAACTKGRLLDHATDFGMQIQSFVRSLTGAAPEPEPKSVFSLRRLPFLAGRDSQPKPART